MSIPCPTWAHDPPSVDPTILIIGKHTALFHVRMYVFTFGSKADMLLSVIVLLVHFEADKP